ncbi:MAG: aminopeptidase P family protein [Alphaproteobacteria bacterium]|nr:aminopeptidase P family protein [Alphaproteobacteria bacterium]
MTHPDYSERLSALRREITRAGFDGFIVPHTDLYQNEALPACAERVAFLTGFTGSAGMVLVLKNRAAFFTDSRYTLQAAQQVSRHLYEIFDIAAKRPEAWLAEQAHPGMRLAYDPWLHTTSGIERLSKTVEPLGASLVSVARNFVDIVWEEQPPPPAAPAFPHPLEYAGKPSSEKRRDIAAALRRRSLAAAVITDAASVAWLLNVRGGDVPYTPLPLSRAILDDAGGVQWFVDLCKVTDAVKAHLDKDVSIEPPENFPIALDRLARAQRLVLVDPTGAPSWVIDALTAAQARVERGPDPCALSRAIKNAAELEGMRAAHRRDGAAVTSFLAWLDTHGAQSAETEISAAQALERFREGAIRYRGPSFATISATGAHGALVHYTPTEQTNAPLQQDQLYLFDSGGQYLDGTTDVTRTVVLGAPTAAMKELFTRVLKGHIALAAVRFPRGTTGADLDVLARQYLWEIGCDYGHGTGHGVGCYLGVHESPPSVSLRSVTPLAPGMILSNEPGYYKKDAYGIRIESLMTVVERVNAEGSENRMLGFDMLTLVPIDRKLIEVALLSNKEIAWINAYHKRVRKGLEDLVVDDGVRLWLEEATAPLEGDHAVS